LSTFLQLLISDGSAWTFAGLCCFNRVKLSF